MSRADAGKLSAMKLKVGRVERGAGTQTILFSGTRGEERGSWSHRKVVVLSVDDQKEHRSHGDTTRMGHGAQLGAIERVVVATFHKIRTSASTLGAAGLHSALRKARRAS
jgi:hypothetical protein